MMAESLLRKEIAQLWMEVSRLHAKIADLKTQTGEQRIESEAFSSDAPLYKLARAALRMAYTWNDHNFPAPEVWLREKCIELGINSIEEANSFLAEQGQKTQEPADSELLEWMEEAVEYVNVPTRSPSLEEEGRKLLRRAGKDAL